MLKRIIFGALAALLLAFLLLPGIARAQQALLPYGTYTSYSAVVGTTATTIWPAATYPAYVRVTAIDTAIQSGSSNVVSVWCAWGTAAGNAAVIGSNGFPLNAGFDDNGTGVAQTALNCIQSAGAGHYVRLETR